VSPQTFAAFLYRFSRGLADTETTPFFFLGRTQWALSLIQAGMDRAGMTRIPGIWTPVM
jgi:hypothetical protein